MNLKRNGSQASMKGPEENFTGNARIDPLFQAPGPAVFGGASVSFEPGARSAWHTHPCGQTLIVTAGLGWTQCWGEPKAVIRPGDVITCPAGKKHSARGDANNRYDPYRHPGVAQRQERRVAGEGD